MGAADREKAFESAERLLRSGKVPSALEEFRRLADESPRDLQMLNRIGDSLARAGRNGDAIAYYERIADQFAAAGFFPKAVAILKKVTRLDADRAETLIRLGEFHVKQKLAVDAKGYLLRAGEILLRGGKTQTAKEVYGRLVAADPADARSRVRYAEACAAASDPAKAVEELLAAAGHFAAAGQPDEAIRTYRRGAEIAPANGEVLGALAAFLASCGKPDEAVAAAEEAVSRNPDEGPIRSEWFVILERAGQGSRVRTFLESPSADAIADGAIERALREAHAGGGTERLWERIDVLLERWSRTGKTARAKGLLEKLADIETGGHVPALERLLREHERSDATDDAARTIERLLQALEGSGDASRMDALRESLREHDPRSPWLGEAETPAREESESPPAPEPAPTTATSGVSLRIEAPPVPLTPADHEFVTGHLTEADVFQKYRLFAEAIQQVREAVRRFPGHLPAQERLVELLRAHGTADELRDALVETAWARRAAGDTKGAGRALDEARNAAGLDAESIRDAERLGILAPAAASKAAALPSVPAAPTVPPEPLEVDPSAKATAEDEWVIEFDGAAEGEEEEREAGGAPVEETPAAAAGPPSSPGRVPTEDMLQEIEAAANGGRVEDAARKIDALRLLGFGGEALDALEALAKERVRPPREPEEEEDDLSTITAALEAGSTLEDGPAEDPAPEAEESLEEVFGAFKKHVDETVGADDFRTRYDLGIAYKEMGLVDDAMEEFRAASRSPDLFRDACTMLGLCHRERGEYGEAVVWYRRALEGEEEETESLRGVRYDLAEVLLERGDVGDALALFREVLDSDPTYRDVRRYVHELQSKVGG